VRFGIPAGLVQGHANGVHAPFLHRGDRGLVHRPVPDAPPWTQANSPPERSTPCSTTPLPCALTSLFPDTCSWGAPLVALPAWLTAPAWLACATTPHAASRPAQSNPTAAAPDLAAGIKPFIRSAFLLPRAPFLPSGPARRRMNRRIVDRGRRLSAACGC